MEQHHPTTGRMTDATVRRTTLFLACAATAVLVGALTTITTMLASVAR